MSRVERQMSKVKWIIMKALLLLATLLIAQNPRPEYGSISGLVRAADGSPAAGVRVTAMAVEPDGTVTLSSATLASLSQTDAQGRYLLENVPPGRYFITAGFVDFPSYYPGVKTSKEARAITVASNQRLTSIDFTLAVSSGVRVRGRVPNLPPNLPPGILTASLQPLQRATMLPPIAPVTGGEFEFSRVPPGSYNVRVAPGTTPPVRIDVEDKDIDIDNIELVGGLFAFGRVAVDDGSPIPLLAAAVAAGVPDAPSMIQVQANRPGMAGVAARNLARKDGFFLLPFGANSGPGEYLITATPIPIGYYLKSITSGTTDLLRSPLKLVKPLFTEIHVVLTRTPPPGTPAGVTVSGRVTQLENARPGAPVFVSMQSAASATNDTVMTAEEPVNPDGTFQIRGVPPGRYVVRSIPPSVVTTQTVEVAGVDVKGLEFSLRAPGAPSVGGTVTQISTSLIGGSGLRFTQSGRGPAYTEGAVTFFLVLRDNKPIIDVRLETSASVALPAGSYALRSYVRPCDGNCALLNAPRDECATTFTLETSQILAAERVMEGARCTIRITNSR